MENKDIDKLFNERLINLEATPTKRVWNNIEADLKKRKRRIVPIWWFSGGVAAVLLLGVLLFSLPKNAVNKNSNTPIIIANPEINIPDLRPIKNKNPFNKKTPEIIVAKETKVSKEKEDLRKEKTKETIFLVADELRENEEKEIDNNVLQKNKEKKYLVEASVKQNIQTINNKAIIAKENVLIKKEKAFDLIDKTDLIDKNKKKYRKKDILVVLNNSREKEKIKKKKLWTISSVVAVLNANSFSNTSPISKNLGDSTKGDNSYSYGIQVAYQLDNKWSIQSGVHLQEMHFTNNQIVINEASSAVSNVTFNSGNAFSLEDFSLDSFSLNTLSQNANLSQVYGYIEIPIEIKYNILKNKKFRTELVAGFSSLFLNKNSVNLKANKLYKTGKANNLNNVNFSGNLGVDFNYQFNKKWSLNLNPMFKTQLNTFNKNSEGFKPYFIGIYTGINYQF